jgi:hypothetical protein
MRVIRAVDNVQGSAALKIILRRILVLVRR